MLLLQNGPSKLAFGSESLHAQWYIYISIFSAWELFHLHSSAKKKNTLILQYIELQATCSSRLVTCVCTQVDKPDHSSQSHWSNSLTWACDAYRWVLYWFFNSSIYEYNSVDSSHPHPTHDWMVEWRWLYLWHRTCVWIALLWVHYGVNSLSWFLSPQIRFK